MDETAGIKAVVDGVGNGLRSVVDLDRDGTFEIIVAPRDGFGTWELLRAIPDAAQLAAMDETPYFGCPC